MHRLFEGETGPMRDNVILNTAACLMIGGKVKSMVEGISLSQKKIDDFSARQKLEEMASGTK